MSLTAWSREDLQDFRYAIASVAELARSATANVATTLTTFIFAVLGAAVALSVGEFRLTNIGAAMLVAIGACALAALLMILFHLIEAVRANRCLDYFQPKYFDAAQGLLSHDEVLARMRESRVRVSIFWKVIFPAAVLALGLIVALAMLICGLAGHPLVRAV
jgi:ABC-type branched-subunit amino acid transport system permease subunit